MPNKRGAGQNKKGGSEIFVKFNKQRGQNKWGDGISKNPLTSVMNEKRK